jgi:outer membrane protein, heavy metal efflux system
MMAELVDAFRKPAFNREWIRLRYARPDQPMTNEATADRLRIDANKNIYSSPSACIRGSIYCRWLLSRALVVCILCSNTWPSLATEPERTPLTLAKALALTLEKSPVLSSFSWDIRAAEARIIQAKLVPNPEISLEGEDFTRADVRSATESMQNTLELSQLIELGGKRDSRVREAQFDRVGTEWDYQVKRLEVLKLTSLAFIDVLTAQRNVQLAKENVELTEGAVPVTQKRVEAGKASDVELVRTQTAVATARIRLTEARRDLETARVNLAAQWGAKKATFTSVSGNLDQLRPIPSLGSLNAKLQRNPDLARWTTERQKREATLNLARAEAKPDLTLRAGPRLLGASRSDLTLVAGFSIPLPLWNRNQGKIAEAEANVGKAADERASAEAKAYAELNEAYQVLARAAEQVRILRETVLPGAKSAVDQITEGYAAGRFSQLDVLDAQRTYNESRTEYVKALSDFQKAQAQIDALTARPVELSKLRESRSYQGNRNNKVSRDE